MAWGALAAAAGGLVSSGAQMGMNYGSALLSADIQRDLRRKAYQDQMHSMKEAGLNPILAYGGTPGAGQGNIKVESAEDPVSSAQQIATGASQRSLMKHQEATAKANAAKATAEAETAEAIRDAQISAKWAEADQRSSIAWGQRITAGPEAEKDRAQARHLGSLKITEDTLRDFRRGLLEQQSAAASASAYEHRQRGQQIERGQPEYLIGEEGGKIWRGAERGLSTIGDILGLLRPSPRGTGFSAKRVPKFPTPPTGAPSIPGKISAEGKAALEYLMKRRPGNPTPGSKLGKIRKKKD